MEDRISQYGGWCSPSYTEVGWPQLEIEFPQVSIDRGGILYPMPQLDTEVAWEQDHWWQRKKYFVIVRQYGQDKLLYLGPYKTKRRANEVKAEIYAWYTSVYNVIIRTYKATERSKK